MGINTKRCSILTDSKLTELFGIEIFSGAEYSGKIFIIMIYTIFIIIN